jgi:HD superfamily phosphohydrolase
VASTEVRDAVHGLIELPPQAWDVVDSMPFQRLRGVQQLAMTHLVYPGARHSRFEHCIGASYIAWLLADRLKRKGYTDIDPERVRLAALVHDIGHGPFSHVSEEVFERLTGLEKIHEKISAAIVRHHSEVNAALGDDTADWISQLLSGTGHALRRSVERDIIAGPADIDKLDYLLRDSHYCGVQYGRYDLDKMIEVARAIPEIGAKSALAFHQEGIYALEEMLLARYHMHRQVYGHKTRIATDRMLVRAMELGVEEGILDTAVFAPPEALDADFVNAYMQWDDAEVTKTLLKAEGSRANEVMSALVRRRLFKRILRFSQEDLRAEFGRQLVGYIIRPGDGVLATHLPDIENRIAAELGIDGHWVTLYWEDLKSPISTRYDVMVAANDIMIVDDTNKVFIFREQSEVFTQGEQPPRHFISLYLRPPNDKPLPDDTRSRIRTIVVSGLEVIGKSTASVR